MHECVLVVEYFLLTHIKRLIIVPPKLIVESRRAHYEDNYSIYASHACLHSTYTSTHTYIIQYTYTVVHYYTVLGSTPFGHISLSLVLSCADRSGVHLEAG